jgi:hypothetical protein
MDILDSVLQIEINRRAFDLYEANSSITWIEAWKNASVYVCANNEKFRRDLVKRASKPGYVPNELEEAVIRGMK